jgi:hypothetical protein
VGSRLIEARFDLIRTMNLRGLVAGSLPIDYHKVAHTLPLEEYVGDVVAGRRFDSNLSKQLRKGFQVHSLIPDYTDNEGSAHWGVEIVWLNPNHRRIHRTPVRLLPQQYALKSPMQSA